MFRNLIYCIGPTFIKLHILQIAALLATAQGGMGQVHVLTYHNDLARTGQNLSEVVLTPANVNPDRFGKLFSYPVDGYVYAQPLYVSGLSMPGAGTHNVVFVATEHDSVYAFDADGGGLLWHASFIDPAKSVIPVPDWYTLCGSITPEIGITGTPVIDLSAGTLYVVASTYESPPGSTLPTPYVHRLHALDITTGAERPGSPATIEANVPGTADDGTTVSFNAELQMHRAGLVLWNGVVYTAWTSHCDRGRYHGWIIGYDSRTLKQVAVYNNTANANAGSFWASGAAPAVDTNGNMYVIAANGSFDGHAGGSDLSNSFIKLSTEKQLIVIDYFAPFNVFLLNDFDVDLGSSGAMLLPDDAGGPAHPHVLVSAGKEGRIYVVDRDNMGHYQPSNDGQIVQSLSGVIQPLFGIPAYFNKTVYFAPANDFLKAFAVNQGTLSPGPASVSTLGYLGAVPSISANGSTNGILWLIDTGARLLAYDAADLSKELYNSDATNERDTLGSYVKFSTPTIANGKVYAGTQDGLVVFGLLPAPSINAVASAAGFPMGTVAPGSLMTVFGSNLALHTEAAAQTPLPALLGGATLLIDGNPAPLLYAGPEQLNAQVPWETPTGVRTAVVVSGNIESTPFPITVQETAPVLFTTSQNQAVALNQDGTSNGPDRPAAPGTYVAAFLTGLGPVDPAMTSGAAAPMDSLVTASLTVTAFVGNQPADVQFAGLAPGLVGVFQVNLRVPVLTPGSYPLRVEAGGVSANVAEVQIGK